MAEENENQAAENTEAPVFRMQKMYIKDLSFENPNSPDVFLGKQEPKVEVNLGLKNKKMENDHWEIVLSVTATVTNTGEENQTLFIIELEHAAVFVIKNIPQEHMAAVLAVDCPTLLFPFTRQIVSQISVDGGFIPFLMEPVNFMALYQNAQKKKDAEAQQ
jgi:preprotein translocase subunit SecB